jgi:hypothetical protein
VLEKKKKKKVWRTGRIKDKNLKTEYYDTLF